MNIPVLVDLTTVDVNEPIKSWADRLSAAGQTVVLGMVAVFAVLAILWFILAIMGKFFTKNTAVKPEKKEDPSEETAPAQEIAPVAEVAAQNDEEIVAAITAAISVMIDRPQSAFRVVSFRQSSREAFRRNNFK